MTLKNFRKINTQYALFQCGDLCYVQITGECDGFLKRMAIQFARLQYVQRSKGQSSCHKGAYNARDKIHDLRQERTFNYSGRGDCAHHAVLLPEGASEKYKDISELWNAIEAIENRVDSQVAKEMVLALPDNPEINLDDKIAMTRSFLKEHFIDHGLICQVDIHEPHCKENKSILKNREDHEDGKNWHAHVLMTTRPCLEGELFGNKARSLDVDVRKGRVVSTDKQWGILWANHQNQYFKENGIDLVVDPVGVVPEMHLGPVRMRWKLSSRETENAELIKQGAQRAQDERLVMQHLLRQESTFEKENVERFAKKHVVSQEHENFFGRFWSSKELVLVGEKQYTSKTVLREEQKMLRMADRLANKNNAVAMPQYEIELNEEQKAVVDYVCEGANLTCVEGRAGTGKSRALFAIRETYEAEGKVVRGLAPTSSVADDMQKNNGFKQASNIHKFLFGHHHGKLDIQYGNEVWLVDEATMVSNPVMGELLDKAWRYNAKVVLVGDDKQLHAIDRGGAFKAFVERFGSVFLETIMRQKNADHREITTQIAEGKTKEALHRMADVGMWQHYGKEQEAVQGMMNAWYDNYKKNPNDSFMILEYRNQYVKEFNNHIHSVLKARGEVGPEDIMIKTAQYGFGHFGVGDSLVFRENDSELGIYNGQRGFLVAAGKNRFVVRVDDEKDIEFDPQQYNNFQHGYAGTFHSVQGRTFDHVFALHSDHVDQNLFYVAMSRHRLSGQYFSYGDRQKVYQNVATGSYKELCQETFNAEPKNWLCTAVMELKDYMCRNHEFYQNSARHYRERGVLITGREEHSYLQGYRTLRQEDQEAWPNLEGVDVRTTLQNRDLESFLRSQGVSQCILLDAGRNKSQLIGPYDRFHAFFQENRKDLKEYDITETQLRMRLFALEKHFSESPQSAADMIETASYRQLIHNETHIRPELLKTHDEHTATQMLYHFEKTGAMPTNEEQRHIQQRVNAATQQFKAYQKDHIFTASLPREDQKMVQFQKQIERER